MYFRVMAITVSPCIYYPSVIFSSRTLRFMCQKVFTIILDSEFQDIKLAATKLKFRSV